MNFLLALSKNKWFPFLFLLVGTVHGLIYVFLMPPWQHYDEPGHFEYAWLMANSQSIPKTGMYDNSIRLKILQSMKEYHFFNTPPLLEFVKDIDTLNPAWIGVTQVGDPPLYYWLAALPLRFLKDQPVEIQLYATRLVSLVLWLSVLFISWLFAKEITPVDHPLQWLLPNSLALLPAFVEHSTALNNDIAATVIYSLIILFGTRLIKNGFKIFNVLILLLLLILSYFTKASIWLSVLVIPLAFFFTLVRNRSFLLVAGILTVVSLISISILFEFNDVAYWYRDSSQTQPTKAETEFGSAIQIVDDNSGRSNSLMQEVNATTSGSLKNKTVTMGVWMWGAENIQAYPPSIKIINSRYEDEILRPQTIQLHSTPSFYSFVYQIPKEYRRLYFVLEPFKSKEETGFVFFQNPILVQGDISENEIPVLLDQNKKVSWNGKTYDNLIRNSDSRSLWPKFRSDIIDLMYEVDYRIGDAANMIIYSLDVKSTFWYTQESTANIFRSFWGKFGWGQIRWEGRKPYILPFIFTIIGIIPGIRGVVQGLLKYRLYVLVWFGFAVLGIFFYSWFTGISMQSYFKSPVFPDVRYMFPAVLILMGIIASGWETIISRLPIKLKKYGLILYILFFIYLDFLSLYTIQNYYAIK
jgi:hypothetical protein